MTEGRVLLDNTRFALTLERMCHQLIETFDDFQNTCLVGIQPRGGLVCQRVHQRLLDITKVPKIEHGKLDITFYRDDFRRREPLRPSTNSMNFFVEGKNVILFDDVLYTGRTIQAALAALQHYGRPAQVYLVTMVDRRFNRHLPIQANFKGITVDALDEAYVRVEWAELNGEDKILIFDKKDQ
jgi:pyrimidine operon attenuation protein / uracil phosphoribosyltransferase